MGKNEGRVLKGKRRMMDDKKKVEKIKLFMGFFFVEKRNGKSTNDLNYPQLQSLLSSYLAFIN